MSNASNGCPIWRLQRRSEHMTTRREFIQISLTASVGGALAAASPVDALPAQPVYAGPAQPKCAGHTQLEGAAPARLLLYAALFDRRFSDSRLFSWAAQQRGIAIREISGDVTDVWYSELHPRWKEAAAPIAGVTTYGALFCLERLAWDHGMRVVYRGSHQRRSDRTIEHRLEVAAQQIEVFDRGPEAVAPRIEAAVHQTGVTARQLGVAAQQSEVLAPQPEVIWPKLSGRDAWPVEIAALIAGISPVAKPVPLNRNGVSTVTCVGQCVPRASEPNETLYSWVIAPRARA
jgi:hypothetical protein